MTLPDHKPFTAAVMKYKQRGWTNEDLANKCMNARSASWFSNLVSSSAACDPPPLKMHKDLAFMLNVSEQTVTEWIYEEWFRVRQSFRVKLMAPYIDSLTQEDASVILQLLKSLAAKTPVQPLPPLPQETNA